MAVYVDRLAPCVPTKSWRWNRSSHLIADTLDELHAFAAKVGLRRAWFQPGKTIADTPHYDLNEKRHAAALELGAELLERKAFVAVIRRLRGERLAVSS